MTNIIFGNENIRNEIIRMLKEQRIDYSHHIHEAVVTSTQASNTLQIEEQMGIKALILKGKNSKKNYLFNIPSHMKLDMKAIAELVGERCVFEAPEVIKERFGIDVGGIPPFGSLLNLETYFDERIREGQWSTFSCGLLTESITMKSKDLIKVVQPQFGCFSKV